MAIWHPKTCKSRACILHFSPLPIHMLSPLINAAYSKENWNQWIEAKLDNEVLLIYSVNASIIPSFGFEIISEKQKINKKWLFTKSILISPLHLWLLSFPLNRHGKGLIIVIFLNILLLFVIPFSWLSRALSQNGAPQLCEAPVPNSSL